MVRGAYVDQNGVKKGKWSEEEDDQLRAYILRYKAWNWRQLPRFAGLARCGKSCRLRWENYLKPGLQRGGFSKEEEDLILKMHEEHGNKWSLMAKSMPGRTDNQIKNYWHAHLSKHTKPDPNSSGSRINARGKSKQSDVVDQNKKAPATICSRDQSKQNREGVAKESSKQIYVVDQKKKATTSNSDQSTQTEEQFSEAADCFLDTSNPTSKYTFLAPDSTAVSDEGFGSFGNDPFSFGVLNSQISPSTSFNSARTIQDESFPPAYKSPEEVPPVVKYPMLMDSSNSQILPSTSSDFLLRSDLEWIAENCIALETSSLVNNLHSVASFPDTFPSLGNEPPLRDSSNTEILPSKICNHDSFSTETFPVDASSNQLFSSSTTHFYPSTAEQWPVESFFDPFSGTKLFPSISCNSASVTKEYWRSDENFCPTSGSILTEPFSMDALHVHSFTYKSSEEAFQVNFRSFGTKPMLMDSANSQILPSTFPDFPSLGGVEWPAENHGGLETSTALNNVDTMRSFAGIYANLGNEPFLLDSPTTGILPSFCNPTQVADGFNNPEEIFFESCESFPIEPFSIDASSTEILPSSLCNSTLLTDEFINPEVIFFETSKSFPAESFSMDASDSQILSSGSNDFYPSTSSQCPMESFFDPFSGLGMFFS